jgi:hypothetical protein
MAGFYRIWILLCSLDGQKWFRVQDYRTFKRFLMDKDNAFQGLEDKVFSGFGKKVFVGIGWIFLGFGCAVISGIWLAFEGLDMSFLLV